MTSRDLSRAIGKADENIVASAGEARRLRRKKPWLRVAAAVLCFCISAGAIVGGISMTKTYSYAVSLPELPEETDGSEAYWRGTMHSSALNGFSMETAFRFFSDSTEKNFVYSPVNLYLALSMLAETASGESREQVMRLLGADSVNRCRDLASWVFLSNYQNKNGIKCLLSNSIWLDERLDYKENIKNLSSYYYASVFKGKMGSDKYDNELRKWLNESTGGLLKDSVKGMNFTGETVMALASALYLNVGWETEFREKLNEKMIFNGLSAKTEAVFMKESKGGVVFKADGYSAVMRSLKNGSMWFFLPDEGKSVSDVLGSGDYLNMVNGGWDDTECCIVNLAVPKFDVKSDLELSEELCALGVTDVFDPQRSDFSETLYCDAVVSEVKHSARVKIDEKGVEGAAFTVIDMKATGAEPPEKEIDFILDRPFVFVITGETGFPVFIGAVNDM